MSRNCSYNGCDKEAQEPLRRLAKGGLGAVLEVKSLVRKAASVSASAISELSVLTNSPVRKKATLRELLSFAVDTGRLTESCARVFSALLAELNSAEKPVGDVVMWLAERQHQLIFDVFLLEDAEDDWEGLIRREEGGAHPKHLRPSLLSNPSSSWLTEEHQLATQHHILWSGSLGTTRVASGPLEVCGPVVAGERRRVGPGGRRRELRSSGVIVGKDLDRHGALEDLLTLYEQEAGVHCPRPQLIAAKAKAVRFLSQWVLLSANNAEADFLPPAAHESSLSSSNYALHSPAWDILRYKSSAPMQPPPVQADVLNKLSAGAEGFAPAADSLAPFPDYAQYSAPPYPAECAGITPPASPPASQPASPPAGCVGEVHFSTDPYQGVGPKVSSAVVRACQGLLATGFTGRERSLRGAEGAEMCIAPDVPETDPRLSPGRRRLGGELYRRLARALDQRVPPSERLLPPSGERRLPERNQTARRMSNGARGWRETSKAGGGRAAGSPRGAGAAVCKTPKKYDRGCFHFVVGNCNKHFFSKTPPPQNHVPAWISQPGRNLQGSRIFATETRLSDFHSSP